MFTLHYSNCFDSLADVLTDQLREHRQRGRGLFERQRIVCPNRVLARHIELIYARREGVAANLEFVTFRQFLSSCIAPNSNVRLLDRQPLCAALCSALADADIMARPSLAPLKRYLHACGDDPIALSPRRHQLASELAAAFASYRISQFEVVRSWPGKLALADTQCSDMELWQRELWQVVFGPGGTLAQVKESSGVSWIAPVDVVGHLTDQLQLPNAVWFVGHAYLAPAYYGVIAHLSRLTDVHVLSFNPCQEFWEDVATSSRARENDLVEQPTLLDFWGRAGRVHTRLLNRIADFDFESQFRVPDPADNTVLARIQRDVVARRSPAHAPDTRDDSVRVLACPSLRRELEVVAAEIVRLLSNDSTLNCGDFCVLLAGSDITAYQALIPSIFAEIGSIPHHLLDVPLRSESRIPEALSHLFHLPLGSFTRPEVLRVLTHPAVLARYPDIGADDWLRWSDNLGIVHGADHADHRDTYIERDVFNWDQGLRRLALGAFMLKADADGNDCPLEFGGTSYVPEELSTAELGSAARFALLARSVIADAKFCRRITMPLSQWRVFFELLATSYITTSNEQDSRAFERCRGAIATLEAIDVDGKPVDYATAHAHVIAELTDLTTTRGELFADGVMIAPISAARPIPFKYIFVAGLSADGFPASGRLGAVDLRQAKPVTEDVTSRDRDRYAFLSAFMCAQRQFTVSYVARDPSTGEPLDPSSVVLELEHIASNYADTSLRTVHALHGYDARYFPSLAGETGAQDDCYAARTTRECAVAHALRADLSHHLTAHNELQPPREQLADWLRHQAPSSVRDRLMSCTLEERASVTDAERILVPISVLRRFLESPLQAWASLVLGLRDGVLEDLSQRVDEKFDSSILETVVLLRTATANHLLSGEHGEADPDHLIAHYQKMAAQAELSGRAPTGLFQELQSELHADILRQWCSHLQAIEATPQRQWHRIAFGGTPRNVNAQLHPAIHIPIQLTSSHRESQPPRTVELQLYGCTELLGGDATGSVVFVKGSRVQPKHLLRGFIDQVVLAAGGVSTESHYTTVVTSGNRMERYCHTPMDSATARAYARTILSELFDKPHAYLMPCEAVFSARDKAGSLSDLSSRELVQTIAALAREGKGMSCRYGPVGQVTELSPPPRAAHLAQKRFAPLFNGLQRIEEPE